MDITLDQALQKGIEAHKAGEIQEADRYYTAVLNAHPDHPDGNHNKGILAMNMGKFEEALPFFKNALKSNLKISQHWASYIDALIKLNRTKAARQVLSQAKKNGIKGGALNEVEAKLLNTSRQASQILQTRDPPQDQLKFLVDQYTQGKLREALKYAKFLLQQFPRSAVLFNINGAILQGLKQFNLSKEAYCKAINIKPDFTDAYNNLGNVLTEVGELEDAINTFNKAISLEPTNSSSYNNMGVSLQEQGKLDKALEAYKMALSIKPDYAEAYYNLGNILKELGNLEAAQEAYNNVLSIKPDNAEAYNNMGVSLQEQGKLDKALEAYKMALSIKPDYAEAYNNMGATLKEQGNLDKAIEAFTKALAIKSDYPEVYNNIGVSLQEQGKLDEAIGAFTKALSIRPDYAEVYWNLHGTSRTLDEAKNWLQKCLDADENYTQAKLTVCALRFYEGDQTDFNALLNSSFKDHPYTRSFEWAFSLPELPPIYFHRWALFDQMIKISENNRPFYEFGVWKGEAFKYLIKTFKKGYGFDTFEGLPEDWHYRKAGSYSSEGKIPKVEGGEFIKGNFNDTLPDFFSVPRPMASIINFDADLYSSTICALNFAQSVIDKDTILIFDEFIINKNWEQDEYRALEEFCATNNYEYKVIGISFFTKQVALKLIGIQ